VPTRASCLTRAGPQPCAAAKYARRDSNPDNLALNQAVYQIAARAHESRHPVPTRITCLTKAGSQPCVTADLRYMKLPEQDSNLHLREPGSRVLPS
jgi:hypothetical protein